MSMRSRAKFLRSAARSLSHAILFMGATVPAAHAYIDPGTGSMLLQLLGAGVAAALFYVRSWRTWLTAWLFGRKHANRESADPEKGERS